MSETNDNLNTPKVDVHIQCEYMLDHSNPDEAHFAFAYHVQIQNNSEHTVQLLNRKWVIMDANGQVKEVQGDGVIGEQPVIKPSHSHFYSSWSVLSTPVGCMQGWYGMRIIEEGATSDGVDFHAEIPVFTLAVPGTLN